MRPLTVLIFIGIGCLSLIASCTPQKETRSDMQKKVNDFVEVELTTDLSHLSENEKQMLPLLIEAARIMDHIFWTQAYGDKDVLLSSVKDEATRAFIEINYGPWERLNNNQPFVEGVGPKPAGSGFYPADMTTEEFEAFESDDKRSLYTLIRRNADGSLVSVPYSVAYREQHKAAALLLRQAAELAAYQPLQDYLNLRAEALLTDDYLASDMAWMDMRENNIDFVVGPIENYEDALFNYKAAHEAYLLIKDMEWSQRLDRFTALLPDLQQGLPVDDAYKAEVPGSDSDMGVYDAIYYAGDCNAGSKTIAINLPNDPIVHIEKGSRKLQLKNAMRYKFDKILVPISELLIDAAQQEHITFDAFFENTMFHEVAHGLGIKNTINDRGTVRDAHKELYSSIEENKADILGLYMVGQLVEMGELSEKDLMDNYVTFMAGIFRSVRFGAASAHGKSNMLSFYFFEQEGAFSRDAETETYKVDFERMKAAINQLAEKTLTLQGNGDYEGAKALLAEMGFTREALQSDLDRINQSGIPVDIRFKQGPDLLGLQ
ncbi:dipeptidyl-peptidase 3 family protein [Geofilum rubicundum]|uniref:Nudix hydrolase 3 n=1 Tax=Geofilum rubicundum JCM 15548 TaxID=1236989 RepID=A0A0E9LYF8_9BACT|nr:Zn-dependent hydrolase [Geofilum rubicundum]GAO30294.1 Nudix hydrolase 3 [Geofilum rubicundum JCM 15548]